MLMLLVKDIYWVHIPCGDHRRVEGVSCLLGLGNV